MQIIDLIHERKQVNWGLPMTHDKMRKAIERGCVDCDVGQG